MSENPVRPSAALQAEGWNADEIEVYERMAARREALLAEIDGLAGSGDPYRLAKIMRIKVDLTVLENNLAFAGMRPDEIPVGLLRRAQRSRHPLDTPAEERYRGWIKNRATAIRAFCVSCQGGEVQAVLACEAMNCPLWPFRMGTDPLRGKTLPPPAEAADQDAALIDDEPEPEDDEEDDDAAE